MDLVYKKVNIKLMNLFYLDFLYYIFVIDVMRYAFQSIGPVYRI